MLSCSAPVFTHVWHCFFPSKHVCNSTKGLHTVSARMKSGVTEGKDNKPFVYLCVSSIVPLYPLFPFSTLLSSTHTHTCSSYTRPRLHIHRHSFHVTLILSLLLFFAIYLCLRVSDLCSCDPCSMPLFYDSGPKCHSNLGQHHKEQALQILWHT